MRRQLVLDFGLLGPILRERTLVQPIDREVD